MSDPTLEGLFFEDDQESAKQQAMSLANALRGQQAMGAIYQMSGDRRLAPLGASLAGDVQKRQDLMQKTGESVLRQTMDRERANATAKAARAKGSSDMAEGLRKEFMGGGVFKNTAALGEAYSKMRGHYEKPSVAGDIGMVYGIMKMFDPGSSVKEGEQTTAQKAGNVPSQLVGIYNRLVTGEGALSPKMRDDFMSQAGVLMEKQMGQYKPYASEFGRLAQESGLPESDVILDLGYDKLMQPKGGPGRGADGASPSTMVTPDGRTFRRQPNGKYLEE